MLIDTSGNYFRISMPTILANKKHLLFDASS